MEGCLSCFFSSFPFSSLQNTSLSSAERVVGCTQWQKVFPFSAQEGKFYIFFEIYIFHSHFALPSSFPLFPVPLTLLPESTISLSPHSKYRKRSRKKLGHLMYRSISTRRQFARIRKFNFIPSFRFYYQSTTNSIHVRRVV